MLLKNFQNLAIFEMLKIKMLEWWKWSFFVNAQKKKSTWKVFKRTGTPGRFSPNNSYLYQSSTLTPSKLPPNNSYPHRVVFEFFFHQHGIIKLRQNVFFCLMIRLSSKSNFFFHENKTFTLLKKKPEN